MDNDLERSVRLLEDSLSTPNRGLFKKKFGRTPAQSENISNLSIGLEPELKNIISKGFSIYDSAVSKILQSDQSITGNVLQSSTAPWKNTFDSLYTEFFEILSTHSGK